MRRPIKFVSCVILTILPILEEWIAQDFQINIINNKDLASSLNNESSTSHRSKSTVKRQLLYL